MANCHAPLCINYKLYYFATIKSFNKVKIILLITWAVRPQFLRLPIIKNVPSTCKYMWYKISTWWTTMIEPFHERVTLMQNWTKLWFHVMQSVTTLAESLYWCFLCTGLSAKTITMWDGCSILCCLVTTKQWSVTHKMAVKMLFRNKLFWEHFQMNGHNTMSLH